MALVFLWFGLMTRKSSCGQTGLELAAFLKEKSSQLPAVEGDREVNKPCYKCPGMSRTVLWFKPTEIFNKELSFWNGTLCSWLCKGNLLLALIFKSFHVAEMLSAKKKYKSWQLTTGKMISARSCRAPALWLSGSNTTCDTSIQCLSTSLNPRGSSSNSSSC